MMNLESLVIPLMTGTVAGLMHTLSGPDHLAAVAPLAAQKRQAAWRLGFRWGVGHASGVLAVGLLSLWFREILPLDTLSFWGERMVGIVLIGIGLWGLRRVLNQRAHQHAHEHDGMSHAHFHLHDHLSLHDPTHPAGSRHVHSHAALAIGVLHGLAGSSHLFGVLPALAFPSNVESVTFLIAFGGGTVAAMSLFSSLVGELFGRCAIRGISTYQAVMTACSLVALAVGGYWLLP